MELARKVQADAVRTGELTYLASSVESSLYGNGKVFMRRDSDGNDSPWEGTDLEKRQMAVRDARCLTGAQRHTLHANGFELVERPMESPAIDFFDHDQIVRRYYPHCAAVVRQETGARIVAAFDHNIRSVSGNRSGRRIEGGQQVQPPIHMVHGDYTLTSGPRRLRDLAKAPTGNDTYRTALTQGESLLDQADVTHALGDGRFAIINLWRNIAPEPVATEPLGLCDAATVHPDDLVVFEVFYSDRTGENYLAKTRRQASLVLLSRAHPRRGGADQAVGFGRRARALTGRKRRFPRARRRPARSASTAPSADPTTAPDAPDRWSIEVRCVALYG